MTTAALLFVSMVGLAQPPASETPAPPAPSEPSSGPAEAEPPSPEPEPPAEPSAESPAESPAEPPAEPAPAEATPPTEAPPPAESEFVSPPEPEPAPEPTPEPESEFVSPPADESTPEPEPEPIPEEEIAVLQPPPIDDEPKKKKRPDSLYGRLWAGPVLGASQSSVAIGLSATYFVVPYLGLGAELVNVFAWDPSYYEFQFTPQATLLMLPRRRFSPLFWGGFGVDTFNKGLGTYGRWTAGGGVIMMLGRRLILTVGVEVDGRVPESRWNRTFACGPFKKNCTMGIGPALGISIPFG